MSDLERQRLANIERNQKALRNFQLKELSNAAFGDQEKPKPKPKSKHTTSSQQTKRKRVSEEFVPRRRSARLAGIKAEDSIEAQLDERQKEREELEMIKEKERERKDGELKLPHLVEEGNWDQALKILRGFGGKVSQGDLFKEMKGNDKTADSLRDEFDKLKIDERDIKVTSERITAICFHPAVDKKLVLAGDKIGELGLWDSEKPDDEGVLTLKTHSRGISTTVVDPDNAERLYTASYDGSIRRFDLNEMKSTEAFIFQSDPRDPVGVSDMALIDPNTLYYSTLDGRFGRHDLRESPSSGEVWELHDKKIGGFAYNPMSPFQVATGSLDRTLKVWDLRYDAAHLYGEYSSRLSISAASWNTAGKIVCNGYDNTINLFNLDSSNWNKDNTNNLSLEPDIRLGHNCQTGRWVSILKARWQERPMDGVQKFVIANMKRYIDIYTERGQQIAHLDGDIVTAVPAVTQFHRTHNWVVGGTASGKLYLWT